MADVLVRGDMAELFDTGTNILPEMTHQGAIIVLDLPTKVYGQAGILAQSAFTYVWQLACEQRDVKANPRPVFWFCDEFQELICNYTPEFLATARSARVASVLVSQNKPNYMAAMGGESGGIALMHSSVTQGRKYSTLTVTPKLISGRAT